MKKSFLLFGGAATLASACSDLLLVGGAAALASSCSDGKGERPNILLILVDDMGYSDLGCFGGEIPTPNLDRLAARGVRYTQFYNTARSCPTRASLLTGLYPHQAGIGAMTEAPTSAHGKTPAQEAVAPGYLGYLNRNCVTMAEVLRDAGYHTYMVGKWHLGMSEQRFWPLQRGFDRFYGILAGACNYLRPDGPRGLALDNEKLPAPESPYYTTDAFTDYAMKFLETREDDRPFFMYLAYNAPHWPLQAKDEDIAKFSGRYDAGWEAVRKARFERMVKMGLIDESWGLAEWESRSWDELSDKERANSARRMEVYAAQVHCMDYNVGRLLDYLDEKGELDNTLVVFLSDNGACAEPYSETGSGTVADINSLTSSEKPSYGLPWSQVSNTPYRKYKVRAYEGGISAPMILSWPARYTKYDNQLRSNVAFLPDLMATFVDVAGATYPETYHDGQAIHPLEGESILPTLDNPKAELHEYIFGEHFKNNFVRWRNWKLVKDQGSKKWELYDVVKDRTERHDVAAEHPEIVERLAAKWQEWADTHNVFPKR